MCHFSEEALIDSFEGVARLVIVGVVFHPKGHKRDAGLVQFGMVRTVGPAAVVPEQDLHAAAGGGLLNRRLQGRRVARADRVELVSGAAADHVEVQVQRHLLDRHRAGLDKFFNLKTRAQRLPCNSRVACPAFSCGSFFMAAGPASTPTYQEYPANRKS